MKFYNETKPPYLEKDASGIGFGAALVTNQRWYNRPNSYCPRQHHSQAHHICKQMPNQHRAEVQQH